MLNMGLSESDRQNVWRAAACVLHIGNIEFEVNFNLSAFVFKTTIWFVLVYLIVLSVYNMHVSTTRVRFPVTSKNTRSLVALAV